MTRCQLGTDIANFTQNNVSFIECEVGDVIDINLAAGRARIIYSSAFNVPQGYTHFTGMKEAYENDVVSLTGASWSLGGFSGTGSPTTSISNNNYITYTVKRTPEVNCFYNTNGTITIQ